MEAPAGQPGAPAAPAAPPSSAAAAAAAAEDRSKKNRVKKLKAQYLAILELEQRTAAGEALDAGQAEKVARKAAVADELAALGAALPEPPPPPQQPGGSAGGHGMPDNAISQAEALAALEALALGGGAAPQRAAPPGVSPMLRRQLDLLAANPGYDYFLTLPEPLPDMVSPPPRA